ncbi:MAG: Tfp pilus assembly protein FimT/FimU [Clostridia bacterium]
MSGAFNIKGHTLIELIIVIAITSVLTSICILKVQCSQDVLLEKCANRLVQDIRCTQMKTVYEKNTSYEYKIYANYGDSRFQYKIIQPEKPVEIVKLDQGIEFESTIMGNYASFKKTGVPVRPGSFKLRNKSGQKIEITIEFSTGRVRKKKL